jgi:hypothetical protein
MKRITIHQPQYIPWVPYFDKILRCDEFVFLDNVQFQKNGLQNRNQIKGPQGVQWLTIPVKHSFGQLICETQIANRKELKKHLKTLEMNYKKAPCFDEVFALISDSCESTSSNLSDFCCEIIIKLLNYLGYEGQIVRNSDLGVEGKASNLVLNICQERESDIYISGQGGKNYLNLEKFINAGIQVEFQKYQSQEYQQCFSKAGFCKGLSIIDLLFNEGKNSLAIIENGRIK